MAIAKKAERTQTPEINVIHLDFLIINKLILSKTIIEFDGVYWYTVRIISAQQNENKKLFRRTKK